jgi:signal transduction histidine kinase/ActR/RegA family two-component response regulator
VTAPHPPERRFSQERVEELLRVLELMASGDTGKRLSISPGHDELDAIAHAVNVLVGELSWASERAAEAQEQRAAALREAAARAEEENASKTTFLRNVNHEIRTPVTAMLAFADLLATDELTPEDRADLVQGLRANGLAVLALLGDLLDVARGDARRLELAPEPVSLLELVRDVQSSLAAPLRKKGIALTVDVAGEALAPLRTDRSRVRQILVNVIGNAVKFTDSGSVHVSLGVEHGAEHARVVDVTDTGIGIPSDHQARLFEPFEQGSPGVTRRYGGSGLGLALSRRLAEQLGGSLELVRSEAGEGATFRLVLRELPLAVDGDAPSAARPAGPEAELRGARVLLAEDHADIRRALARLLESAGASVDVALDGGEAVARASSGSHDLVLMDLRLPEVDGLEAARALRERGYGGPIVALTADPLPMRREEALRAGCDACLRKPFTMNDLVAAIAVSRAHRRASAQPGDRL